MRYPLPDTTTAVPQPRPVQPVVQPKPVNAPRIVNFTGVPEGMAGNEYYGGGLEQIAAQRQALAEAAGYPLSQVREPFGGAAYMVDKLGTNLRDSMAQSAEQATRDQLSAIMGGIDLDAGPTQEDIQRAYAVDPEYGKALYAQAVAARNQEVWGPVVTGEQAKALGLDPSKSYQLNAKTGKYDQVGGGGTSVTINPPSAEMTAKLGLANGFLDNYDAILKSIDAGEMTGVNYLPAVTFGRGNGGTMYRNLLQGTEAMVRILTGAGMSEGEARQRVTQYEPAFTDDAATLRSKVQGLKQALDNIITSVANRGKEEPDATTPAPDATTPEPDATTPAPDAKPDDGIPTFDPTKPEDLDAYDALPDGAPYRSPGDPTIHHKGSAKPK